MVKMKLGKGRIIKYSLIICLSIIILWISAFLFFRNIKELKIANWEYLFNMLNSTVITVTGFLATIFSILIGLRDSAVMDDIKKHENLGEEFIFFIAFPCILALVDIVALIGISFVVLPSGEVCSSVILSGVLSISLAWLITIFKAFSICFKIIRFYFKYPKKEPRSIGYGGKKE